MALHINADTWPCRCCGHRTHAGPTTGWTLQVCNVCGWEDGELSYESEHHRFGNDHTFDDAQAFYQADRARLVAVVEDVFADVTLDGGDSLYDAELHDSYGYVGEWITVEHRQVEARWQDITAEKLRIFPNGGPCIFLDTKGLRFYLPAYMRHELDPSASVDIDIDTMLFAVGHDDSRHRDLRGALNAAQFDCVCNWLRTLASDLTHWNSTEASQALRLWDSGASCGSGGATKPSSTR